MLIECTGLELMTVHFCPSSQFSISWNVWAHVCAI